MFKEIAIEQPKNYPDDKMDVDPEMERVERHKEAERIAQLGSFDLIEQELEKKGLLQEEKDRVKELFSDLITNSDFPTKSSELYTLLTITELYDKETAIHSLKTYHIAKEKVEKALSRNVILAKIIESEGVELESFYFACLTHDVGKVEIPQFIIQNPTTENQWNEKLQKYLDGKKCSDEMLSKLGFDPDASPTREEMEQRMEDSCMCPKEILPVKEVLTEEDVMELEQKWKISPESSLMDIIEKHAYISGSILESKNFPMAAELVKSHHHKEMSDSYNVSIDSLKISSDMADILHLADVDGALMSIRAYKEGFTSLEKDSILIRHAEEGEIGKEMTYLWIKDDYKKLKNQGSLEELGFAERKHLKRIEEFIESFESGSNQGSLEKWLAIRIPQLLKKETGLEYNADSIE